MEKVSSRQIILLITVSRVATVISFMPTIHMPPANQDIWLMNVVSFFYTVLMYIPILFLAKKFKELTIIGYMEKIFGRVLGKPIVLLYGLFFTLASVYYVGIQTQVVRSTILTQVSNLVIVAIMMITCIYIATRGLEVIARSTELFAPIIIAIIIIFVFIGYKSLDLTLLLPIFKESTFFEINLGAIEMSLTFVEISILIMIVPNFEDKNEINTVFLKSVIYSLVIIIMTVVVSQGALGIEQAKHSNFPFFTYTRLVAAQGIVERIESIYVFVWLSANIGKITAFIYISSRAFREILGKKEEKANVIVTGIIIGLIALYISNRKPLLAVTQSIDKLSFVLSFIFLFIIPLVAMIVYFFRRKSLEEKEKVQS